MGKLHKHKRMRRVVIINTLTITSGAIHGLGDSGQTDNLKDCHLVRAVFTSEQPYTSLGMLLDSSMSTHAQTETTMSQSTLIIYLMGEKTTLRSSDLVQPTLWAMVTTMQASCTITVIHLQSLLVNQPLLQKMMGLYLDQHKS